MMAVSRQSGLAFGPPPRRAAWCQSAAGAIFRIKNMTREDAMKIAEWYKGSNESLANWCNIHAASTNYLIDNADGELLALIIPHAAELRNTVQALEILLTRSQCALAKKIARENQ